ncbi:MAG TPA: hypothetical protein VJ831_04725 [Jatrophihabitantaceae bacterium]|nr:hypothetical protein [Jatrophihabitantaceae bacterium]
MLTNAEIEHFVDVGYVRVEEAIPRAVAVECRDVVLNQLGVSRSGPWRNPVVRGLADDDVISRAAESPRLVEAVSQLLRGEPWDPRPNLGLFVVRCPSTDDPGDTGWHIDASFEGPDTDNLFNWYVNYRSQGRGLLLLCLLSDVGADNAPTRIRDRSHHAMPGRLRPFGEGGVHGLSTPVDGIDGPVSLATGRAGDVYLCHPFLVHAATWPHRGSAPRVIAQPPISLHGPLRLDADERDLSPVARPIAAALAASASAPRGSRAARARPPRPTPSDGAS